MRILVINGPNINMIGIREKSIYGEGTYDDLIHYIEEICTREGIDVEFFQSNHEGEIIDAIQAAYQRIDGIVINPAAYTHTSIAILDALKAVAIPTVEVHLSNIHEREEYRQLSYVSEFCLKTFTGLGFEGYEKAVLLLKAFES